MTTAVATERPTECRVVRGCRPVRDENGPRTRARASAGAFPRRESANRDGKVHLMTCFDVGRRDGISTDDVVS